MLMVLTYSVQNTESWEVDPTGYDVVGQADQFVVVAPQVLVNGQILERRCS